MITGEPPPPLTPGTVNLYTREYFQLIYDRLAEGGIATYWLPIPFGWFSLNRLQRLGAI